MAGLSLSLTCLQMDAEIRPVDWCSGGLLKARGLRGVDFCSGCAPLSRHRRTDKSTAALADSARNVTPGSMQGRDDYSPLQQRRARHLFSSHMHAAQPHQNNSSSIYNRAPPSELHLEPVLNVIKIRKSSSAVNHQDFFYSTASLHTAKTLSLITRKNGCPPHRDVSVHSPTSLSGSNKLLTLYGYSKEEWDKVLSNNTVVLLDCFAEWCGPCKAISPVLEK